MPYMSKKDFNKYTEFVESTSALLYKQNKQIVELNTKIKHMNSYIEFLEGCIKSRVDVDFNNEWIFLGDNPNSNHKWSCKKCGHGIKEQEKFCPNCGAKMHMDIDFPNSHKKGG